MLETSKGRYGYCQQVYGGIAMSMREPYKPQTVLFDSSAIVQVSWRTTYEIRRELKMLALETNKSLADVLEEAVEDYLQKYGRL